MTNKEELLAEIRGLAISENEEYEQKSMELLNEFLNELPPYRKRCKLISNKIFDNGYTSTRYTNDNVTSMFDVSSTRLQQMEQVSSPFIKLPNDKFLTIDEVLENVVETDLIGVGETITITHIETKVTTITKLHNNTCPNCKKIDNNCIFCKKD